MDLAKFQLDLRPRPNAQALDLGFALLRRQAGPVYIAWLLLWLPLVLLATLLAQAAGWSALTGLLLAWWLRPLCERAPLYMLSRLAFGEQVSWRAALRAWPRQLGGGWLALLTWQRPFAPGRGLYQPVWLLEQARGKAARLRRRLIAGRGTGTSAIICGVMCGLFELVLQAGALALIVMFLSAALDGDGNAYVFRMLFERSLLSTSMLNWLLVGTYALAVGIVGPIYTACCFTLYLNRRATLEAWDLEIMLRQLAPPPVARGHAQRGAVLQLLCAATLAALLLAPSPRGALAAPAASAPPATAATPTTSAPPATAAAPVQNASLATAAAPAPRCQPSKDNDALDASTNANNGEPRRTLTAEQTALKEELTRIYASAALRGYVCEQVWRRKHPGEPYAVEPERKPPVEWQQLATILKLLLIATVLVLAGWLLVRYRGWFARLAPRGRSAAATEIAGLDIRAESLPDDVPAAVRRLWAGGERRAALALLYRATLSRLVHQHNLAVYAGATEGECLQLARAAQAAGQLSAARLDVVRDCTLLWLDGAYGGVWPETAALERLCGAWQAQLADSAVASAA